MPFEPVLYPTTLSVHQELRLAGRDIIITGKNSVVAKLVDFSSDLLLSNTSISPRRPEFADVSVVDRPGVRIAVPRNASDGGVSDEALKSAELVRLTATRMDASSSCARAKRRYGSGINTLRQWWNALPGSKNRWSVHTGDLLRRDARGLLPKRVPT